MEMKNAKNVAQSIVYYQWREMMNQQNEIVRNIRCVIENIDKILATEHLDYKKGEELRKKRDEYSDYLKSILPSLQGVDY